MAWITNVITRTTIQSVWGNAIRDRVVHQYASMGERDASPAGSRVDGSVCYTVADRRWWVWRADQPQWLILWEHWQPWNPEAYIGGNATGVQADLAESRMIGDLVTIRILVKNVTPGLGPMMVSLPPTRGNAGPQGGPVEGILSGTDFVTGVTAGFAPIVENGRFYGRRMSDWAAAGPGISNGFTGGTQFAYQGQFSYRAAGWGP